MMLMIFGLKVLAGILLAAFIAQTLLSLLSHISREKHILHAEDLPGWRSYATFKPLSHFADRSLTPVAPFDSQVMYELCERLRAMGARIEDVSAVGIAQRVILTHGEERWELTAAPFSHYPTEQWLLTVDQHFWNGNSAPHDTQQARLMFATIREALEGMEVSTIRWHSRQHWNNGQVDAWAYKPF